MNDPGILHVFFSQMSLIRQVERLFLDLFSRGMIRGTVHTCYGQEACAVGVMNAVDRDRDVVFSNHRGHGHFLAYSMPEPPLKGFMAEVMALPGGLCGGRGGSQHLHWRNFYSNGVQGGMVPLASGAALAEKKRETGAIVIVFIGDGTMGQGIVYESLNIASCWQLPVLFVLEQNCYAQTTSFQAAHSGWLERRAEPFDIATTVLDGNDVVLVYNEVREIAARVRSACRPHFLVLNTYRLGPHSKGDDIRSAEEISTRMSAEPLVRVRQKLDATWCSQEEERIAQQIREVLSAIGANAVGE